MRHLFAKRVRIAILAGTAMLASGCGGDGDDAANEAMANEVDANLMLDAPTNDASAMESAVNATEPLVPLENGSEGNDGVPVLGNTSGGDTGGNTVSSNVSGT